MSFTPLHVYSGYTYLKSALKLDEYVKQAKAFKYDSIGLCDFDSFSAFPRFVELCKKANIKPIIGQEIHIDDIAFSFYVLNEAGYRNLLNIYLKQKQERLDLDYIRLNNDGLVVILSTDNKVFKEQFENQNTFPKYLAKLTRDIQNIYLGLSAKDLTYNQKIRDFSYSHGYTTIAFPSVKYLKKEDAINLKILEAIDKKETLNYKKLSGDEYLYSLEEITKLFNKEEIEETNNIASMVNFNLLSPRGKMIKQTNDLGLSSDEYLKRVSYEGLKAKGLNNDKYISRLKMEIKVISEMGYSDYFLTVKDFIDYARKNDIAVGPGRGSAVGSLVSYTLGITQCDPIKYDLIFERFLNKERQTLPDIDVDFSDTRREEVVDYLRQKYGNSRVSKIIAIQKFGAKQALGDIGKVFGYERRDIELFTKLITKDYEKESLRELYKHVKEFRDLVNEDKYYLEIVSLAQKIEGLPRQSGMHAAGVVINAEPLEGIIPLSIDFDGCHIEEFEKDYLEDQAFLKMDLLSLTNLSIIDDCISRLKEKGISIDRDNIPYDDPKSIDLIRSAKTMGLFQIESFGMRKAIKVLKPTTFDDVAALLALYRPGPMANIPEYAKGKQGKKKITYVSSALKEILEPTYGIIVYQEQVMQIANKMAGFSFGEADLLRRAISKKDSQKLASFGDKFVKGAIKNGYKEKEAKDVYNLIFKFGDYGFNKSHALGYAILTCRMAYLKAHYPKEFYASILSTSNSENFITTIGEIKANKIKIANPSINESTDRFLIKDDKIIFPLTSIKGIMSMGSKAIMDERKEKPFTDFFDFVLRMNKYRFNSKQIMALIDAGAFDELEPSRATLRLNIPAALNYASMVGDAQGTLVIDLNMFPKPTLARSEDDLMFNLNKEFDALGLMLSGSPLQIVKNTYKNVKFTSISEINISKGDIKVPVIIRSIKSIRTKSGKPMAFSTIYDESGEIEITIFTDAFEKSVSALKKNNIVIIDGYYKESSDELSVKQIYKLGENIDG